MGLSTRMPGDGKSASFSSGYETYALSVGTASIPSLVTDAAAEAGIGLWRRKGKVPQGSNFQAGTTGGFEVQMDTVISYNF